MSKVFGIVGNTLYIEPFYGGDTLHKANLDKYQKKDFIFSQVKVYETEKELADDYWSYLDKILDDVNDKYNE